MSCDTPARRLAEVAARCGIASRFSRSAFLVGASLGAVAGAAFWLKRLLPPSPPDPPANEIPTLAGLAVTNSNAGQPRSETITIRSLKPQPVPIQLKQRQLRLGLTEVEGYAVADRQGKEMGLTISPAIQVNEQGGVGSSKRQWYVNYDRVEKPIAGPYQSLDEAEGMASQLARLDWRRSMDRFSDAEIRWVAGCIRDYRQNLNFREYMRRFG